MSKFDRQLSTLDLLAQLNIQLSADTSAALGYARGARERFNFETDDIGELISAFKAATRVFFSQADAMVFLMRKAIVEKIDDPGLRLSSRDRAWLLNSPDKARFLHAAKLVFTYFPRLWGAELVYTKDSEGYRAFQRLAICRGRFTHPNTAEHLLPVELLLLLKPGAQWFMFVYTSFVVQRAMAAGVLVNDPAEGRELAVARDEEFRLAEKKTGQLIDASFPRTEAARIEMFLEQLMLDVARATELVPLTAGQVGWAKARWSVVSLVDALVTAVEGATHTCGSSLAARGHLPDGGTRSLLQGDALHYRETIADIADCFATTLGRGLTLARSGEGWNSFLEIKRLRDQLSHPRGLEDVAISPRILSSIIAAAEWIRDFLIPLFQPVPERIIEHP